MLLAVVYMSLPAYRGVVAAECTSERQKTG